MRLQGTDKKWYSIKDADMAHKTDAVKYWNSKGGITELKQKKYGVGCVTLITTSWNIIPTTDPKAPC